MGLGDDIMATAFAAAAAKEFPQAKIVFGDGEKAHWSEIFENNPHIAQPTDRGINSVAWVQDYPGHRHYIDYVESKPGRLRFRPEYRAPRGELHFTEAEIESAGIEADYYPDDFILIEPNVKGTVSADNKDWGFERWQKLVRTLPEDIRARLVQVGQMDDHGKALGKTLVDVPRQSHFRFRSACAFLARSAGFIGTDGGLHHAAAALGLPAVVIWGGYSSPEILGYPTHRNIYYPHPESPCGRLEACEHCRAAMARITVDEVASAAVEKFPQPIHVSAASAGPGMEFRLSDKPLNIQFKKSAGK